MSKTEGNRSPEQPLALPRDRITQPARRAILLAEKEIEQLNHEENSFKRFGQRVSDIEPSSLATGASPLAFKPQHNEALKKVQVAYRETVMAVDHYEKEYGESYTQNIQEEFGTEIAELLKPNSQAGFTPVVKKAILKQANCCAQSRQQFAKNVDLEIDTLQCARAELNDILDTLDAVDVAGEPPCSLRHRIRNLNEKRQQVIQSPLMDEDGLDGHDLRAYLYADADWTYPILLGISRLYNSQSIV